MNFNNSIEHKNSNAKPCSELLREFKTKKNQPKGIKLNFVGAGSKDVYNSTPPFLINGEKIIAARVESREDDAKSNVMFFKQQDDVTWVKIEKAPIFELEDPFVTKIDNENIFGGVEVFRSVKNKNDSINNEEDEKESVIYRTVFYKGKSLDTFEKFAIGPEKMKDVRIIGLENGHIGVFTRPQGGTSGRGKIGYIEINGLVDLNPENILKAKIIENQFTHTEWGGANQLHLLEDGKIGVIGHIACFDKKDEKHYYGTSFVFDPKTFTASPLKIIAVRDNFPAGDSKKPNLKDVIFVGGIDEKLNLYAGLGDAEDGVAHIDNPF